MLKVEIVLFEVVVVYILCGKYVAVRGGHCVRYIFNS